MRKSDYVQGLRVSLVRDASTTEKPAKCEDPAEVLKVVRAFVPEGEEREHFLAIYMDARSQVKGVSVVSIGTLTASLVHPREVFRPAIVAGAAAVIIAHNHPSGEVTPSSEDREATRRLVSAGRLLGIAVLDHVIFADGWKFFSFREGGLL